jgi:hypothetical protein
LPNGKRKSDNVKWAHLQTLVFRHRAMITGIEKRNIKNTPEFSPERFDF